MKLRYLIICSLFTALIAVGAFIRIPTATIPFTLQVFFVILTGLILPPKLAAIPPAVYMALGLIGVPIFAKGGGFAYVLEPSFGYIAGFILLSFLISLLVRKHLLALIAKNPEQKRVVSIIKITVYSLVSIAALYAVGITYMYLILNFYVGSSTALGPLIASSTGLFIVFDIIKAVAAAAISAPVLRRMPSGILPRRA